MIRFKRILLKMSGESLAPKSGYGIDPGRLKLYVDEIKSVYEAGVEVCVVLGGGNIFRGLQGSKAGLDRVQGDYMGMLATIINSLALKSSLKDQNIPAAILSGLAVEPLCGMMNREQALKHIKEKQVLIIAGGTGNPFFTTDTAAALRAVEIEAEVLLKATRVDGVYNADPEKDPTAAKYTEVTYDEVYANGLKVMDLTAFTLCRENNLPIIVFDINKTGNLKEIVVEGKNNGTLIRN